MSWLASPFILLVLFAYLAWRQPRSAAVLLCALLPSYLWRGSIFGLPTTWLELAIYVTALAALWRWGLAPWRQIFAAQNWRWLAPAGLWLLAAIVGTLVAPDKRLALGELKGWVFDPMLLVATLAAAAYHTGGRHLWRDTLGALLAGAAGTTVIALVGAGAAGAVRLAGWYDSPNVLAMYLVPIAVAALTWYAAHGRDELSRPGRRLWILGCAVTLLGIVLTNSYAALAATVLALGLYVLLRRVQQSWLATALATVTIVVGLTLPFAMVALGRWVLPSHSNATYHLTSGETRFILWREATHLVQDHPLFGLGLGQWQPQFQKLIHPGLPGALNPGYLIELYYASLFPHNLWLATWLSLGLMGVAALAWLTVLVWRAAKSSPLPAVVLASILLQGLVDTPLYKNDLSVLFWVCVLAAATLPALRPPTSTYAHRPPGAI